MAYGERSKYTVLIQHNDPKYRSANGKYGVRLAADCISPEQAMDTVRELMPGCIVIACHKGTDAIYIDEVVRA